MRRLMIAAAVVALLGAVPTVPAAAKKGLGTPSAQELCGDPHDAKAPRARVWAHFASLKSKGFGTYARTFDRLVVDNRDCDGWLEISAVDTSQSAIDVSVIHVAPHTKFTWGTDELKRYNIRVDLKARHPWGISFSFLAPATGCDHAPVERLHILRRLRVEADGHVVEGPTC